MGERGVQNERRYKQQMRPTRKIVKPNTGLWKPKGSVWFKKNDDSKLGEERNFSYRGLPKEIEKEKQDDEAWNKLSPKQKAMAEEGMLDY